MREEGNFIQWRIPEEINPEIIRKNIEENNCYVLIDNKEILGFYKLVYGIDDSYLDIRGKWLNDEEYVTIHKIVVKNPHQGLASIMLNHIIEEIKSQNIYNIRIDTHKDNLSMTKFIEEHNFKYCGIISFKKNFNDLTTLRNAYILNIKDK